MQLTVLIACIALRLGAEAASPDIFSLPRESRAVRQSRIAGGFTDRLHSGFAAGDIWGRWPPRWETPARDAPTRSETQIAHREAGGKSAEADPRELLLHYSFSDGAAGWLAGFSDYSLVNGDMHFIAEPRVLPAELGAADSRGFYLQSMNRSDDMFMFLKKGVYLTNGLKPNQRYSVSFEIAFASNAQNGCFGVGGAPGEGVYLKAGASVDEPVPVMGAGQHLELNIDKGHQSEGGADAGIAGTIANGEACDPANERYVRLRKTYEHAQAVSTDDRAQLWLMVGTDSAHEGLTGLFYESITVRLKEVE